jgi:hypothetical protein
MGHYASEMNGGNFTDTKELPIIIGTKLLDNDKGIETAWHRTPGKRKTLSTKLEWVNPYGYTKRVWIHVEYRWGNPTSSSDGGVCATYSIDEASKVLSKEENEEIARLINTL